MDEPLRREHARGFDFYSNDVVLGGHSLDGTRVHGIVNQRAACRRIHRVEHAHRNVVELGGHHAGRMQNLCAEIGKLGGLVEMQLVHRLGVLHKTGVVVVHTVYVGPYLYLLGIDGRTDERCRKVAATALQIVDVACRIPAYEALCDEQRGFGMSIEHGLQMRGDIIHVSLAVGIGTHEFECRQPHRSRALLLHVEMHQGGGDKFALSQNLLLLHGGELTFMCKGAQEAEHIADGSRGSLPGGLFVVKFGYDLGIFFLQAVDGGLCAVYIMAVKVFGYLHQRVGGA